MLASLFRSNRPIALVGLVVLVLLLFVPAIWRATPAPGPAMPLYVLLVQFTAWSSWLPGVLHLSLVLLIAVQTSGLANGAELLGKRTHLPALLFPLLLASFGAATTLEPALVGMPLVLAALGRTWSIAQAPRVLGLLFDAGLLLGLAALFYLPYAFLLVVVWASISVIRPMQWREYLLPLIGVAVPIYLAWAFVLLAGGMVWQPMYTVVGQVPAGLRENGLSAVLSWSLRLLLLGFSAVALLRFQAAYQRGIMREKNVRASFMGFFFALAVVIAVLRLLDGSYPAVLLATPLAVFLAYGLLVDRRSWLSELVVSTLFGIALWVQWGV